MEIAFVYITYPKELTKLDKANNSCLPRETEAIPIEMQIVQKQTYAEQRSD